MRSTMNTPRMMTTACGFAISTANRVYVRGARRVQCLCRSRLAAGPRLAAATLGAFMGLVANLLGAVGGKKAARTIAEIEAALARLVSERNIAQAAIASSLHERDLLLLEDESDARISKLDAAADRHRLTTERCDKLEPILLQELSAATGAARQAQWATLRSRYDLASTDFVHKARAAIAALELLLLIRGEAQGTGFAANGPTFAVAPSILKPDLLAMFEFEVERQRDAGPPSLHPLRSR